MHTTDENVVSLSDFFREKSHGLVALSEAEQGLPLSDEQITEELDRYLKEKIIPENKRAMARKFQK